MASEGLARREPGTRNVSTEQREQWNSRRRARSVAELQGRMKRERGLGLGSGGIDLERILQTIEVHADRQHILTNAVKAVAAMHGELPTGPVQSNILPLRQAAQTAKTSTQYLLRRKRRAHLKCSRNELNKVFGVDKGRAGPFARSDQTDRSLAEYPGADGPVCQSLPRVGAPPRC